MQADKSKRFVASIAPATAITIASILAISLAVVSSMLAMRNPWIGLEFDRNYDGNGIKVERVYKQGPAAGKFIPGDVILSLESDQFGNVSLSKLSVLEDPDQLPTYSEYNDFFKNQQKISEIMTGNNFVAVVESGKRVDLQNARTPSPFYLPADFWLLIFFGGASFLLGVSVLSMRSNEPVTRVIAVSGTGFMIGAYSCAIYLSRELALPGNLFFWLTSLNHLGIIIFAYAAILFFWYYPKKLGVIRADWIFVVAVVLVWLNETLQISSWPLHAFYAHFVFAYCCLILFASLQWVKSKGVLVDRAMLRWVLLTMLVSLGFTIILFYIPIIVIGKSIASTTITFAAVFFLYVSLITGIVRYHQFNMQYWWNKGWQWLAFILIIICTDILFVYFLQLGRATSISLSIVSGAVYLMLRQWFWNKFAGNGKRSFEHALPHLIEVLTLGKLNIPVDQQWKQLIERVFNPLSVKVTPEVLSVVSVEHSGFVLRLPALDGRSSLEVFCGDNGKRLFTHSDVILSMQLLDLMRHSRNIHAAHSQGVQEERHRIQRDLHDDVAARLLSLMHQTREPMINRVANNALRGLRDVIHLLGAEEALLEDVMTDIEAGAREQLSGLGIHFEWRSPDSWPAVMLSSQQHINLRRISREAIANALKHAVPQNIIMETKFVLKEFFLHISNDGTHNLPSSWTPGRGLNNIKFRVAEMGGSHEWGIEQGEGNKQYCYLAVKIPLSAG